MKRKRTGSTERHKAAEFWRASAFANTVSQPASPGIANLLIDLGNTINPVLNIGWINLLTATILMYGLGRIHGKKEGLEKERLLRE